MVYECETCEAALTPGLIACPCCGQVFDEPVPDDAVTGDVVADQTLFADTREPETERPPRPNSGELGEEGAGKDIGAGYSLSVPGSPNLGRRGLPAVGLAVLLAGLTWFGYHQWIALPDSPKPILTALPAPPTDLAAHPLYAANMAVFVQKLRETGVGVQWSAFHSNDVLFVTPQVRVPEAPTAWTADMYRRLAQGIYGQFAQNRYESGFSETDTTACFVIVTNASGQVMAVDFMGDLQ